MQYINQFASDPNDTHAIRLEKTSILLVAGACSGAGILWGLMYYAIFGMGLTTILPFGFTVIVGSSLYVSHITRNHQYAIYTQIACITNITVFIQWSIGGIFDSGVVLVWAFLGPVCALMFLSLKRAIVLLGVYLLYFVVTIAFDDFFVRHGQVVADHIRLLLTLMNLVFASTVVFMFASYFVYTAIRQQEETNALLQTNLKQEMALRQSEKLATLGQLSAGVAHELNNPVAAAQRGAEQLKNALDKMRLASSAFFTYKLTHEQFEKLFVETARVEEQAGKPLDLDPLDRSDREYEIETWLDERNVQDAWEISPMLVSAGYVCDELDEMRALFDDRFPDVVRVLAHSYTLQSILEEIGQGTRRVSEIVRALKSYTYLDQAPTQSVNIHDGLDDTLIILSSKLKKGVQVKRHYAPDLPHIEAYGSELNQVWTNIIDNAIGAMDGQGEITIKTYSTETCVVVEITDIGPGIPQDVQGKIFDPFFTTKAQGGGTGLGLNISHNIITEKHRGRITVKSKPGETCFEVKLPINYEDPQLDK